MMVHLPREGAKKVSCGTLTRCLLSKTPALDLKPLLLLTHLCLFAPYFVDKSRREVRADDGSHKSLKSVNTGVSSRLSDSDSEESSGEERDSQRSSKKFRRSKAGSRSSKAGSRSSDARSRSSDARSESSKRTTQSGKDRQIISKAMAEQRKQSDVIKRLEEKAAEREDLVNKLTLSKNVRSKTRNSNFMIQANQGLLKLILEKCRTDLWRTCKFMIDDVDGLSAMTLVLMSIPEWREMYHKDLGTSLRQESIKEHWDIYGPAMVSRLNQQRTDTCNGIRGCWLQAWKNGQTPPNPEQFARVVCRSGMKLDPKDPQVNKQQRDWLVWYVDVVLPKAATKHCWPQGVRHYSTPSRALMPEDDFGRVRKAIPSSTEAIALLAVENAYYRWELEKDMRAANLIPEKKELKHVVNLGTDDDPNSGNPDHKKRFPTKYTNCRAGKAEYGAWSHAGRKRFKELEEMISVSRAKKWAKKAEDQALLGIQKKHKIQERLAGKRKQKEVLVTKAAVDAARVAIGAETDDEALSSGDESEEGEAKSKVAGSESGDEDGENEGSDSDEGEEGHREDAQRNHAEV